MELEGDGAAPAADSEANCARATAASTMMRAQRIAVMRFSSLKVSKGCVAMDNRITFKLPLKQCSSPDCAQPLPTLRGYQPPRFHTFVAARGVMPSKGEART